MALPVAAVSLDEADAAIEQWEHYSGKTLDQGQRLDVAVMLATRDDGMWAAPVTGHEKPRQSGKGDSVEVVEFWGLTQRSERILHTIHDAVLLATETQSRMLALLQHPDLARKKAREWKGTGQQMIEMRNGGVIWYRTRTGAGGRGIDEVDRLVVDEAQHAEPAHLAAITPTQAVAANPQLNALGTGGLEGKSGWWWSLRKQAKGPPGAFAWVGYSAQEWDVDEHGRVSLGDIDPTNRDLWWKTIPGLVAGRTTLDFLERELRVLGAQGFAQEYLCVWAPDPNDLGGGGPIALDRWNELVDGDSVPAADVPVRLALDAPPGRESATFAIAGRRPDNLLHVDIRRHVPPPEMSRLVELAKQLTDGHGVPLIIPPNSPARAWRGMFLEAGVELDELTPAEYAEGCGLMQSAVIDARIRHRGIPEMTNAVAGLAVRSSGDVDVWSRRTSSVNIAPFVAATCALVRVPAPEERRVEPSFFMA